MKIKSKVAIVGILFLSVYLINSNFYPHGFKTHKLKEIHLNLYDLYFPDDISLTSFQRVKRYFYREMIWLHLKGNSEIEAMLNPLMDLKHKLPPHLKQEFEDILKNGFENVSIERQNELRRSLIIKSPEEIQKQLIKIRQTWLYIIYSTPLANEIAGIPAPASPIISDKSLYLPKSQLKIVGREVVHQAGDIDYLIIGSGPAGSVIAHELTRLKQGARVVLLEAGPFIKSLCMKTEFDSELMESNNNRRNTAGGILFRNGLAVGGGTTVNLDLAFSPLLPQIKAKLQGWVNDNRLESNFFHESDGDWKKLERAYEWVTSYVLTRKVDLEEVNKNNRLLLEGTPYARIYDLNARKPIPGKDAILKVSALDAFIMPALESGASFKGNLNLIPNAQVSQIEFSSSQNIKVVTGVRFTFSPPIKHACIIKDLNNFAPQFGKEYFIKAKTIIVSAGSLGSAAILLRSSLQNDNIGRGIVIHPSMGVIGKFNQEINVLEGLSASVYSPAPDGGYFFEAMSADPQFIALIHPGSGKDILDAIQNFKKLGGFGIMLIDTVNPSNRIILNSKTNQPEIEYTISQSDKARIKQGLSEAIKILFKQGAQEVFIPTTENLFNDNKFKPFKSIHEVEDALHRLNLTEALNFVSSAHLQGSNKLGSHPINSVVSKHFRVWDSTINKEIPNLYVCDSSVFPTSVGSNPMQSIYTVAKLFTDQILLQTP